MSRRNQGPRLKWLAKRSAYYICWTERGRSRERSTGTADRENAEVAFAEWLRGRARTAGPRDPSEVLVTDILTDYATERGPKVVAGDRIAYAVEALAPFWEGNTVAITPSKVGGVSEPGLAPQPGEDLVEARGPALALGRAQRGVGDEQDAFVEPDRRALAEARQRLDETVFRSPS